MKKAKLRLGIFDEQAQESLLFRHKKEVQKIPFLVSKTRKTKTPFQNFLFPAFIRSIPRLLMSSI